MLLGSPSTQSPSLKPVEGLYHQEEWRSERVPRGSCVTIPSTTLTHRRTFLEQTGDGGAKIYSWRYAALQGTTCGDSARGITAGLRDWEAPSIPLSAIEIPALPTHAVAVRWIQQATGISESHLGNMLGVKRMTVRNWKAGKAIKTASLRRLLETKDVLQRAQLQYPSPNQLIIWLNTPDKEHGIAPARLLSEGDFDRARFLAVLTPSTVEPTPSWAKRPVAPVWSEALEEPERPGEFLEEYS